MGNFGGSVPDGASLHESGFHEETAGSLCVQDAELVIVGGGPAGMMCAVAAAEHGGPAGIVLLEKTDQPGKKLLLAGSGRCNLTHAGPITAFFGRYGDHGRFVQPALFHFTNDDLARFFADRGLPLVELNDGKMFPITGSSRDVRRVLLDAMHKSGVDLRCHAAVERIKREPDGTFLIRPAGQTAAIRAQRVVIATGGRTYPATGSTGDGYRLAKSLGHAIVEPVAALAPVRVRDYPFAECAGLSFENANVRLDRDGKNIATAQGDLLLTHHGLSGPVILDMSRNILPGDEVRVSFVAGFADANAFGKQLAGDAPAFGKKSVKNMLARYGVPDRLLVQLFERNGIAPDLTAAELSRETRKALSRVLVGHPFPVARLGGDSEAMVTRGGVSLAEVSRKTMQSRLVPGLFFCGEVLDIDGDTGGYNLQFAFSSGQLAGNPVRRQP